MNAGAVDDNITNVRHRFWYVLSFFAHVGCGPELPHEGQGVGDASTSTSSTTGPGSSSDPSATGVGSTEAADAASTDAGSAGSTTDVPEECMSDPKLSCDPLDPEFCYGDLECTFDYHPKGGGWVCGCNRGDAGPYEPCTVDPTPADTCAPQQICSGQDRFGPNRCTPLCGTPQCSETSICVGEWCYEPCDPLAPPACPTGVACERRSDGFVCEGNANPRPLGIGEPCDFDVECAHGLVCQPGAEVTGCEAPECCAAVCDTTEPEPCAPGEACVPLFERPWSGAETLGACSPG